MSLILIDKSYKFVISLLLSDKYFYFLIAVYKSPLFSTNVLNRCCVINRRLPQNIRIMKQVVLNVPDNKYPFFMELIKSLGFVKVTGEAKLTNDQQDFVNGTKKSLEQVEQHLKGEIELKSADQLLNEL